MKNKFIPATDRNIEEYKERNYQVIYDNMMKANLELYKGILDCMPSEEIVRKDLDYLYDKNKMHNHITFVPGTNNDFFEEIVKIQKSETEKELIILLNSEKEIIGSEIVSVGDETCIQNQEEPGHNVWNYVLKHKDAKYFIHVHNHPRIVVCEPSLEDSLQMARHKVLGNLMNIKMLDACIVSEFDFYSQYQYEQEDKTQPILNYWNTNKFPLEMIDENLPIWSILRKSFEN